MENKLVVEWFANRISHGGLVSKKQFNDLLEQAKEMEKEQKIKFAENCLDKALDLDIRTAFSNVEQYYNETFKQQKQ